MKKFIIISAVLVILSVGAAAVITFWREIKSAALTKTTDSDQTILDDMIIASPAFADNAKIPDDYGCQGKNVNPPLVFEEAPSQAKSLVLIVDDPDSPSGVWTHWLVWNIDPAVGEIRPDSAPRGAREGRNDFGDNGYGGPCPGSGAHHYHFKLYALDQSLSLKTGAGKDDLLAAMSGHIMAQGELVGVYSR